MSEALTGRLALLAGLTTNEAAALRWGDIDWLRGRLLVRLRLADDLVLALAVADPVRAVAIDWATLCLLERQRATVVGAGAGDGPARFVFPDLAACPLGSLPKHHRSLA